MSLELPRLSQAAFIADLSPRERSLARFSGALSVGVIVFLFANLIVTAFILAIYVGFLHWPAPTNLTNLIALLERLTSLDGKTFVSALEIIGIGLPSNVVPIFAFIAVAAFFGGQPFKALATAAKRFRWRLVLCGFVFSTLLIGPFVILAQLLDPTAGQPPLLAVSDNLGLRAVYLVVCVVGFLPAALGEEVLFRGWLLRQTSNLTKSLPALMIINGILFSAAHLDFAPDAFLERAIMGAGLVYMTLRMNGVELSTGVHFANNLMLVLFVQPLVLKQTASSGLDIGSAASFVGLFVSYIAVAEVTARWPTLRRWSGADQVPDLRASVAVEHFS
jgi:hypothetical protein